MTVVSFSDESQCMRSEGWISVFGVMAFVLFDSTKNAVVATVLILLAAVTVRLFEND